MKVLRGKDVNAGRFQVQRDCCRERRNILRQVTVLIRNRRSRVSF